MFEDFESAWTEFRLSGNRAIFVKNRNGLN